MPARDCAAAVSVLGLIGERGREVREVIAKKLGAQGLKHSVVLAATADVPPQLRLPCLLPACGHAADRLVCVVVARLNSGTN